MNYPEACPKCSPFGGSWVPTETGVQRCDCARGQALKKVAKTEIHDPVISEEEALLYAHALAAMPFFPLDGPARGLIADEIASMCSSAEQARWLVTRMIRLYDQWPGVGEMRIAYCSTHPPLDGILPLFESKIYPDGIPSERTESADLLRLPAPRGEAPSEDPTLTAMVQKVARKIEAFRDKYEPKPAPEKPVIEITDANRITHESILRAEMEYRASLIKEPPEEEEPDAGRS